VLDSTAIAALFFKDPYSERVEETIKKYEVLYTLDLAYSEVANVGWKRVRFFGEQFDTNLHALELATDFMQNACNVLEASGFVNDALKVGVDEKIAVYDSLFLVTAKRNATRVLTTDEKLHAKVQASKELGGLTLLPDRVEKTKM
jgi:predicted nucleic acid-binding protein